MVARSAVGLIAGSGRLPEVLAESIKAQGRMLVVFSLPGAPAGAGRYADHRYEVGFGEMLPILAGLRDHEVHDVVFAGGVPRVRLIAAGDSAFEGLFTPVRDRDEQSRFAHGADRLGAMGIQVRSPLDIRPDLAMPPGVLTAQQPTDAQWKDIRRGVAVARMLAADEVGQVVALKGGVIVAIEAAEGTDATIIRAGGLAEGTVVVKVARPNQDPRFDLPTAGVETVQVMRDARAAVLAMEAGRTLLVDREAAVSSADEAGIAIVGVDAPVSDVRGPMSDG